jgi:hypothetical protein
MAFQEVENVYQKENVDISSVYTMARGEELKLFQIPAYNDVNFLNSSLSHLWSFFSMRTESDYNSANQPYVNGGLIGTSLEYLPEAFYNKGGIAFTVPNSNYRVQVYGQNQALYIPLNSSYTGMTSGLTATTLYSSFIYQPDILQKDYTNLCSGTKADTFKSEPSPEYTNNFGIGYKYIDGKNPNPASDYPYFDSGIVYLVTDSVYNTFSGATGSSISWNYLYNNTNKYSNGARLISFDPSNTQYNGIGGYDRIVGAMFLNYGLGFIFDPELVGAFDWSTVNGDPTSITGGTFTSGQTAFNAADMDLSENLHVKIVMEPNQWVASSNSSYIATGQNCGIAASTITLHNLQGDCLAVVKPDMALVKEQDNYLIFDLDLPLSEPITPQTGSLSWDGVSNL